MNYMRLLKVLYIAERESLAESGKPITGSNVIAMERGPVLEDVFRLIRNQHISTPRWAEFLRVDNYYLEMTSDPGVGLLSRFVTRKLEDVAQRHAQHDEWDMVEITHKLPEWEKNNPGTSWKDISLSDILAAVGRADDLDEFIAAAKFESQLDQFFSVEN